MKKIKLFKPKAIFLMGPTASNKTKIAIMLRQNFPLDIISVDSALIYKGMDIGTAKPTKDQLLSAPHSLLNIIDPSESYSVFDFRRDALKKMIQITYNGKIPLLVGGTMLYFKALLEGLSPLPSPNVHIRQWINQISYQKGWNFLHKLLCNIDIISGKRIHLNDHRRILRALEVFFISGKTMTEFSMCPSEILPYEIHKFIIAPTNKENLYKKITIRFKKMLDSGFEEETYNLFKRGDLHENMPSIRCVGYRQMWSYLSGKINYEEMIFQSISATKQLAKHQFTWLRKNPQNWLDSNCSNLILNNIKKIFDKN